MALSPQVMVYSAWTFAERIKLWNQNSLSFGAWSQDGVDYIFVSPFHSTIIGVVVRGLKNSSVAVAHNSYLVQSHRPLRFGSSMARNDALAGGHTVINAII